MRKFLINVNGNSYEVEVEEIGGAAPTTAPIRHEQAPAAPAQKPAAPKEATKSSAQGQKVSAPMPGNILEVNVSVGSQVNEGDTLCILEAMKMENEILAPCSGKVVEANAAKGATVETGMVLFIIA